APVDRKVVMAAGDPVAEWDLELLPTEEIKPTVATPTAAAAPSAGSSGTPAAATAASASADASAKPNARPGRKPAPQVANTRSAFQRTEAVASGDAAKPATESSENASAATETNQQPSEGFLINGSVNNGASTPFAQMAAFGNNRRG